MAKEKRYKKNDLRLTLQANMRQRRNEPDLTVTPMEFSRMLKCYCELHNLPDDIMRAKELDASLVDAFAVWLGYGLI
ncbi:MAG: hypothetical protein IJT12_03835 [Paludibacteraceae bacterium]|nr:hypothetical protein [Paludibacteraceae bacterium]